MEDKRIMKRAIVEKCLTLKQQALDLLKQDQKQVLESASEDDIDQHNMAENPREGMMEDIELRSASLDFLADEINRLRKLTQSIEMEGLHEQVSLGSVVKTNTGNFLVAVAQHKFQVDGEDYQGISTESPLFRKMEGLTKSAAFHLNSVDYFIRDIF